MHLQQGADSSTRTAIWEMHIARRALTVLLTRTERVMSAHLLLCLKTPTKLSSGPNTGLSANTEHTEKL